MTAATWATPSPSTPRWSTRARLIGPALAGLIIAACRRGLVLPHRRRELLRGDRLARWPCASRPLALAAPHRPACWCRSARAGTTCAHFRPIRALLLLFALVSLMGWPYTVLLPVFASDVLHGGRAHPRLAVGRRRRRGARLRTVAGAAALGRPGSSGPSRSARRSSARPGPVRPVAYPVAVAAAHEPGGLRDDAVRLHHQHGHPGPGARRQARPRAQLLHHGVLRLPPRSAACWPACSRTASVRRMP